MLGDIQNHTLQVYSKNHNFSGLFPNLRSTLLHLSNPFSNMMFLWLEPMTFDCIIKHLIDVQWEYISQTFYYILHHILWICSKSHYLDGLSFNLKAILLYSNKLCYQELANAWPPLPLICFLPFFPILELFIFSWNIFFLSFLCFSFIYIPHALFSLSRSILF